MPRAAKHDLVPPPANFQKTEEKVADPFASSKSVAIKRLKETQRAAKNAVYRCWESIAVFDPLAHSVQRAVSVVSKDGVGQSVGTHVGEGGGSLRLQWSPTSRSNEMSPVYLLRIGSLWTRAQTHSCISSRDGARKTKSCAAGDELPALPFGAYRDRDQCGHG